MPHAPLTVLQLTHQGDGAGSTQSILNLGQHLQHRGHRVLLGCRAESLLARMARDAGIGHVPLDFSRLERLAARLADVIARERVDVLNSHATLDRRALTWLRWRARLPQAFVVTRRTMPRTSPLELFAVGHAADRTIAVSSAVARALRRRLHPGGRLRVVPNGIDVARVDAPPTGDEIAAARAALGEVGDRTVILVVARRKDQDVVLRALAQLSRPVVLACVGLEPDAELAALTAALPSRHRAVFIPFTERPLAYYRLATLVALPSRIEGLSQALLEAMALGVPVVASDAGGNPDLITPDATGVLVPPRDAEAWAATLARLLDDAPTLARLGGAGRELVRRSFTLERTVERTEEVYREALERRALLRGERPR
jgi:glycosyltransferase involved in cell wall biosynthesis